MKKTLLVRMDRLGDLVLTLPTQNSFEELEKSHWWIPTGLGFVAQRAHPVPSFQEVDNKFSLKVFWCLLKALRKERYEQALIFYAPTWVYFLVFLAGIPTRAGRFSQWYSFLLLNRGLRQKRSLSEKSELLYNFELARETLNITPKNPGPTPLVLKASDDHTQTLQKHGLLAHNYVVVHPGMGGSALNWPTENYKKLIRTLLNSGQEVVVTGTKGDRRYTEPLQDLADQPGMHWLVEKLSGLELIDVLSTARWTLAPSTGVAHLSASLGTLTYGLYPPVRAQSSIRWGPQGPKVHVLEPHVECPAQLKCLEEECPHHPCMTQVKFNPPLASDLDKRESNQSCDGANKEK